MKTLLTPLLLTLTTLFFVANANAETFNTNIAGFENSSFSGYCVKK